MGGGAVSSFKRGDDEFHYSDHSHRWIAPPDVDQEVWEAELAAHLETHRASLGRPLAAEGKCRIPRGGAAARPANVPARPAGVPARVGAPARPASVPARVSTPARPAKAPARPGNAPARIIPARPSVGAGAARR
jgi:hypothetical protein